MVLSSTGDLLKPGMESVICDLCHSDQSEVVTRQRDLLLELWPHLRLHRRVIDCWIIGTEQIF